MRVVARWTPNEESQFVNMLIDSSNGGNLFIIGKQREVLTELADKLTGETGKHFSYKKIVNKFKGLRTWYDNWERVHLWDGIRMNPTINMLEASYARWDVEHPSEKKLRNEVAADVDIIQIEDLDEVDVSHCSTAFSPNAAYAFRRFGERSEAKALPRFFAVLNADLEASASGTFDLQHKLIQAASSTTHSAAFSLPSPTSLLHPPFSRFLIVGYPVEGIEEATVILRDHVDEIDKEVANLNIGVRVSILTSERNCQKVKCKLMKKANDSEVTDEIRGYLCKDVIEALYELARPEGSIAEGYIVKECLAFMSMYLDGNETRLNKDKRNYDGAEDHQEGDLAVFSLKINLLHHKHPEEVSEELWALANGPQAYLTKFYSSCIVNEVRFRIKDQDDHRTTQNSGLVVEGEHQNNMIEFYGFLTRIVELTYLHGHKVLVFECEWFNTDDHEVEELNDIKQRVQVAFQQHESNGVSIVHENEDELGLAREDIEPNIVVEEFLDKIRQQREHENCDDEDESSDEEDETFIEYCDDNDDNMHIFCDDAKDDE
ncbi:hypothetical protein BUALT_Bualt05G0112600 [Buddleja alternifolia]|uniref:Myb/SANT-like domain-containing protein n=1 Tax=Buddleja alternifolia TaxID=168488 RepID=A0AAV6XRJ9_9LAMI|nr:hypothetical protein BUALT_Bualt05G0112600 [Buddleja alternifolia]